MPADTSPPLESIGNYDILSKIAEGGMGTVYKGRSRATGELVAIKIIPPATARNPTLLKRFEREFQTAHALNHPNVVRAIEFDASGASPFLVMEYVDGESLGQKIEREGKMPEGEAVRVIAQVCQGLHRAHKQGLVHRDVKPDNVMLTREGVAKLTDLGLVKDAAEELNLTRTGRGLGTPHFMAPEQFRDAKNADVRCDIYSVGATLYMMVTGAMPFGGCGPLDCWMKKVRNDFTPPNELNPDLSERMNWAILRAMSGNPEQRPASCREFVEDLTGHSTRPKPPGGTSSGDLTVWYLVYHDENGEQHTVKGGVEAIRRALKDRLLGDASNIIASRQKQGPFQALKTYPEFRDLVVAPEPMATKVATGKSTPAVGGTPGPSRPSHAVTPNGAPADPAVPYPPPGRTPGAGGRGAGSGRLPNVPFEPAPSASYAWLVPWLLVALLSVVTAGAFFYLAPVK
jgi:serine/threonine protein kinase